MIPGAHIGLIGGIGVSATLVYYQRLAAAVAKAGLPLELTIVHADVQTLIRNNLADNRQAQAEIYAGLIDRLKAAGCDLAAITSLGGHFCYDETLPLASLPLVSAVTPIDSYFATRGIGTIGLLGTEVVMRTRLYGQLAKTRAVVPPGPLDALGLRYQEMAVAGACSEDERAAFFEAGRQMVEEQGAEAVLLAGTDLGLAFDGHDPGYPVVDALDVHVAVLAQLATGETTL